MDKIVVCVFGVNGSGKTALLQAVSDLLPGVVIFRGSTILKESLGVASYETLEAMSSEEKKSALINGISVSVRNAPDRIILVDTHLIVPIRKLGALIIEDMWDDSMLGTVSRFRICYRSVIDGIRTEKIERGACFTESTFDCADVCRSIFNRMLFVGMKYQCNSLIRR